MASALTSISDLIQILSLLSPKIEIIQTTVESLGEDKKTLDGKFMYRIKVGVANTGFLPTNVSEMATKIKAVLPLIVELESSEIQSSDGYSSLSQLHGQLLGRLSTRLEYSGTDGTSDRCLATFLVTSKPGVEVRVVAKHSRAGTVSSTIVLG